MRWLFGLAALAALTVMAAPTAHAQTAEQSAALQEASRVGVALYEYDRSAWLATDAMLAEIRDPCGEGVRGWITQQTDAGVLTVFVRIDGERLFAAYHGLFRDGALVESGRVSIPLTPEQEQLFRARQAILEQVEFERCAPRYNSVTLPRTVPGSNGEDIDIYLMPALTEANTGHIGGYHRVGVDLETISLGETRHYTNTCLTMSLDFPADTDDRFLYVTQIVGDLPTEVHVFTSLTHRIKIYVGTHSGLWMVDGPHITPVDDEDIKPGRSRT